MTAINLPGQLEVPLVIEHCRFQREASNKPRDVQLAELLVKYENKPSSETWIQIQALAKEILR